MKKESISKCFSLEITKSYSCVVNMEDTISVTQWQLAVTGTTLVLINKIWIMSSVLCRIKYFAHHIFF